MADKEVVIKIPEEMYKWINDVRFFSNDYGIGDFIDLIKNGVQLPEGHGRLIDAERLDKTMNLSYELRKLVDLQPTIIEADSESEEDK